MAPLFLVTGKPHINLTTLQNHFMTPTKQTLSLIAFLFLCYLNPASAQKKYFQQEVNYTITVSLDDVANTLTCNESIIYINNSPDELKELYFHLWPNAYKNNSTALCKQMMRDGNLSLYKATPQERGYINQLAFNVNGQPVKWQLDSVNIDICKLVLNFPLKTGDSIIITTPFFVKIPDAKFSRLGHVGQSYMITQWYPKPAVYDVNGWHPLPYLNQGEFYSEFGAFDVTITVPENYVVAATGNLQTASEKLFIENKIQETKSTTTNFLNDFPPSSDTTKTIRYTLADIHDFAWFADKRFHVAMKTVTLANSDKTVNCYAYYTGSQPELWKKAPDYIADAVYNYSKWIGDYAYETCTAIDGTISAGGGMEYPTITNIGKVQGATMLDNVIAHEVGHNWFYGMLGSNERDHAWMDEGINSYYEERYMTLKYSNDKNYLATYLGIKPAITNAFGFTDFTNENLNQFGYLFTARQNNDQPLSLVSENFSTLNYGMCVYTKTSLIFQYLNNYLGDSTFDAAMQSYFRQWKFKHPQPDNIEQVFKESTRKDINWFFNDMIGSTKKVDYKVSSVKKKKGFFALKIKNTGSIAAPFSINSFQGDSLSTISLHEGFTGAERIELKDSTASKVIINAGNNFMDMSEFNNSSKTSGIFKKIKPLQLSFFTKYENPQRSQIFYLPAVGYNVYNGVMGGIVLHNISFLKKKFEYAFVPMYGFQSKSFAGTAYLNYSIQFPGKIIDNLEFSSSPKYFAFDKYDDARYLNYYSVPVGISARLKKANDDPFIEYHIKANFISNSIETVNGEPGAISKRNQFFSQAVFMRENFDKLDPGNFIFTVEQGEKYVKGFFDAQKEITLGKIKKALFVRLFAGTFILNERHDGFANFQVSAWRGGKDYLMQEMFMERNNFKTSLESRQIVNHDGGLKSYYPENTNHWLMGLNFAIKLPITFLRLYSDAALYKRQVTIDGKSIAIQYDGGVCLSIYKDVMEVYFPLIYTKDMRSFFDNSNYSYANKITFVFDIKKLNPAKLRDSVSR